MRALGGVLWATANRLAGRLGGELPADAMDADDLYQEGAVAALAARESWSPTGGQSLRTYCLQRGRWAMVDATRRGVRGMLVYRHEPGLESVQTGRWETDDFAVAVTDDLMRPFVKSDFAAVCHALFAFDSADTRAAIVRRYADDVTFREIAGEVGVSESAVVQRVGSAYRLVRERYTREQVSAMLGLPCNPGESQ